MPSNRIGIGSTPGVDRPVRVPLSGEFEPIYGRVYNVLLTEDAKLAGDMGVTVGTIGAIQFRFLKNGEVNESSPMQTALHLNASSRRFPIKNEVVVIVSGPTYKANNAKGNNLYTFYYKDIVDIWDSTEHNSIPDLSNEEGVTGHNFKEKGDIARLIHTPGDYVQEGRFGNSVRIGASTNDLPAIPWKGPSGSPVYIVRNGQSRQIPKGSKLTVEDINYDGSSLYMLSEQSINFIPASLNFDSHNVEVSTTHKPNIVTANVTPADKGVVSNEGIDILVNNTLEDKSPQKYETATVIPVDSINEELAFLPDREDIQFYQELEDEGVRHIGSDSNWINSISANPVNMADVTRQSTRYSYGIPFISYMQHQQGSAGLKAILYWAKRGANKVPIEDGFTRYRSGGKRSVQGNMEENVGSDFKGASLTPANFLSYWNNKFEANLRRSYNVNPTINSILTKYATVYSVPLNFIRAVCNIESSFNPDDKGDGKHLGLFQLSREEFSKVYPNDPDIFNPDKNSNVGVKLLRNHLSSAATLLNSVK